LANLPVSWRAPRVKHIARVKGRVGWHGLRAEDFRESGSYLITGTDLIDGWVEFSSTRFVDDAVYERDEHIQLREGDVLLTKDGTIGKVAVVGSLPGPSTLNSGLFVIRPTREAWNPRFMYWVLTSPVLLTFVGLRSGGSTIQHLYQETFYEFRMPLPELETQDLIVHFLDRETHRIDALVEAKRKLIDLLSEKRIALITHEVATAEDARPAHVKMVVTRLTSGSRGWAEHYSDIGAPFLRIANVSSDGVDLDLTQVAYVNAPRGREADRTRTKPGDVVLSITADVGSVAAIPATLPEAYVNQHLALMTPKESVASRWLAYALASGPVQAHLDATRYGGTKTQLALEDVAESPLQVPSADEQLRIARELDYRLQIHATVIQRIDRQLALLTEYRQALISAAVTGQLDEATLRGHKPADEAMEFEVPV
jgi:type I restriction enzyme S subunit